MISNESSAKAIKQLKDFCDELKNTLNNVIDRFQQNVEKHIDNICAETAQLSSVLQNVEEELAECQKGSEMFIPMNKLANVHNDVVCLDKKMTKLKEAFEIPKIDRTAKDVEVIETTVQKLLETFCRPSLSKNVFENVTEENQKSTTDEGEKYVPTIFKELRLAIIDNDIDQFKSIVENPKLPPRSINYILQCQFDGYFIESPTSIPLLLAAFNKSFDIVRYIIHLEEVDLLERFEEYNIIEHLLEIEVPNSEIDKLAEEILTIQPKLAEEIHLRDMNLLQQVINQESPYLCRLLVEKYNFDVNAQCPDGSTPLIDAIYCKNMDILKELLSLGASPAVTDRDKNSTLHMACQEEWPEGICELVSKFPEMLNWKNNKGVTPLSMVITLDDVEAMKTIYDCLKQNSIEMNILDKNYLIELATSKQASKILEWAKTIGE